MQPKPLVRRFVSDGGACWIAVWPDGRWWARGTWRGALAQALWYWDLPGGKKNA